MQAGVGASAAGASLLPAVKRSLEGRVVRIKVQGLASAEVSVRGENRRVAVAAGVVQDRFAPLAVHLYELLGQ